MSWKQIYSSTAFCPYQDGMAAAWELRDSLMTLRRYLDGQFRPNEVLDGLRHLEYVCGQPVKSATMQFRRCLSWEDDSARNEAARRCLAEIGGWINPKQKVQRRMTILPDDRYLSGWQRTKARLLALIERFRDFWADDVGRLPDRWKPKQVEGKGNP